MSLSKINRIREEYKKSKIDFDNSSDHPIKMFNDWLEMALELDKDNAISFVLSTVSSESIPTSRVVLLREINDQGLVFFTNYNSSKSKDIEGNEMVAANFFWRELEKQVRIVGRAAKISKADSDKYFNSRPRKSQLGSWCSNQSNIIDLHDNLTDKINEFEEIFKGKKIERPLNWGGYCIIPEKFEFWQGRPSRLHDRLLFSYSSNKWIKKRLSP